MRTTHPNQANVGIPERICIRKQSPITNRRGGCSPPARCGLGCSHLPIQQIPSELPHLVPSQNNDSSHTLACARALQSALQSLQSQATGFQNAKPTIRAKQLKPGSKKHAWRKSQDEPPSAKREFPPSPASNLQTRPITTRPKIHQKHQSPPLTRCFG
jgi:hypothetical protein